MPTATDTRIVESEIDKAPEALGLFLLPQISDAMQAVTWDVKAEIGLLAEIAQDSNIRAAVRMDAAQRIREIVKDGAILSGYIRSVMMTAEQHGDAGNITVSVTGDRFLGSQAETLRKLEEGLALHAKQPQLNAGRRAPRLVPVAGGDRDHDSRINTTDTLIPADAAEAARQKEPNDDRENTGARTGREVPDGTGDRCSHGSSPAPLLERSRESTELPSP